MPIGRLGGEYAAAYGRAVLNKEVARLIPWRAHRPGELHARLLRLPWADI